MVISFNIAKGSMLNERTPLLLHRPNMATFVDREWSLAVVPFEKRNGTIFS